MLPNGEQLNAIWNRTNLKSGELQHKVHILKFNVLL